MATRAESARGSGSTVSVYYAGSLVNLNENVIGPAFTARSNYTYQGQGLGSAAIANLIKGRVATPDVVEFADPAVDASLMGQANGKYISWYFTYATTQLVIGFDPKSSTAKAFRRVQQGKLPWYQALLQKGLRIGRTDPTLDPKGYRALWMARLAAKVFHLRHFERRIFGSAENPSQVFPEQVLVARLLTGQINAGVFYLSEARDLGIPYITLPARINLGSQKYARLYATQSYTLPSGQNVTGAPIEYTISIPSTVQNPDGAAAFVRFVLGGRARAAAREHGLLPLRIRLTGSRARVPANLRSLVGA